MKIICISDTHGNYPNLPAGDTLIHAGDMSMTGEPHVLDTFIAWMEYLPHTHKVFVPGNHDFCFDAASPR